MSKFKIKKYANTRTYSFLLCFFKNKFAPHNKKSSGFSMLELVISVVLLGIIGSLGLFVIQNQLHGNLDSNAEVIVSRLVEAQFRSIAGASNTAWGIRFINGTSTSDRYELFEGDAYTASTITYFLSGLIEFEDPTPGSSTDITFTKLRGTTPVSSTIKIRLKSNPSSSKSISISDKGKLSIE